MQFVQTHQAKCKSTQKIRVNEYSQISPNPEDADSPCENTTRENQAHTNHELQPKFGRALWCTWNIW